jgi:putative DNA primase/helicase
MVYPTKEARPCFRTYESDFHDEGISLKAGLYYHGVSNHNRSLEDERISDPIKIIASIRDSNDDCYLRAEIISSHGFSSTIDIPNESLIHDMQGAWIRLLGRKGFTFEHEDGRLPLDKRKRLECYIKAEAKSAPLKSLITSVGWSDQDFILPHTTIAKNPNSPKLYAESQEFSDYRAKGTLSDWKNSIANYAQGNHFTMIAIMAALAGSILKPIGLKGGGIHFYGKSSTGKTTHLNVASTVWGSEDFVKTWDGSAKGIEAAALLHSDTVFCLDEAHLCLPADLKQSIYKLSDGRGRLRSTKEGGMQRVLNFRVSILSTGENSLDDILQEGGIRSHAGQAVRILNIKADNAPYHSFHDIKQFDSSKDFVNHLKELCTQNYGVAGIEFVKNLIRTDLKVLDELLRVIEAEFTGLQLSSQEARGARLIATYGVAGLLGIEFGILPWTRENVIDTVVHIVQSYQTSLGASGEQLEYKKIYQNIVQCIEKHSNSRFQPIAKGSNTSVAVSNRLGWIEEKVDGSIDYYFTASGLREASGGASTADLRCALEAINGFKGKHKTTGNPQFQKKIHGQNFKVYLIDFDCIQQHVYGNLD